MKPIVVDTNVILVANNAHEGVSPACVLICIKQLEYLTKSGVFVVDDAYRIVSEYQNKTNHKKGKGVGDVFLKWVMQNLSNPSRCHQVPLTEIGEHDFAEFPVPALVAAFDPPDRQFAAVANAHPNKPPILQAADCKWLDWWPQLKAAGIDVEFLCTDDVCRFYTKKFPKKPLPALP